jgi:hypothetical protein
MCRKLVAFSTLCIPYTLSEKQLLSLEGNDPPPEGHNPLLAAEFFARLEISGKYGYDPTKDYRRSPLPFLLSPVLSQKLNISQTEREQWSTPRSKEKV